MASLTPKHTSQSWQKRPRPEGAADVTAVVPPQPKEEPPEEPSPSPRGEAPMVFHVGSAWWRKREKGGSQDGVGVDRRKSKVWNFYTKLGDAYVECEVCKKQLSFHNSTTTMREHLVRKHNLLSQLKDDQIPEGDYAAPENVAKRSRHKEARSEVIPELVLEMICQDLHPLSVAKDKGFGFLLGYLEPGFSIPAPTRLAGALRQRYAAVKRHLERYLRSAETVALCVEFWASQPGRNYVTIAATFIDAEWRRARCVLETQEEDGEEDLGEKLHVALSEFGLSGDAVFCVVHDGAAGEPWRLRGWSNLPCTARALHLCVRAGLEVEEVQEALSAARGVVRYFQRDAKAARSLAEKLEAINKTQVKLATDAASRWLTTLEMCEGLLELKWAIMAVLEEPPKSVAAAAVAPPSLADRHWKLLQDLVAILRTIQIATSFLREEQNASVSALLPCVHGIVAAIGRQAEDSGAVVKTMVGKIGMELRRRWGLEEEALENPAVVASFLDPRFKELRFLTPGSREELHRRVKHLLSQGRDEEGSPPTQFQTPHSQYKPERGEVSNQLLAPSERRCSSPSVYDLLLGKDPTENTPEIHRQLENYVVEPLCRRSADPLDWWKANAGRFPAVARLSRRYLAVPATAAAPDRAFAARESVVERRRGVLEPENLDAILFLHHNSDLLESRRNGEEGRSRDAQ